MLDAGALVSNRCMIEAGGSERYIDMELARGGMGRRRGRGRGRGQGEERTEPQLMPRARKRADLTGRRSRHRLDSMCCRAGP